MQTEVGKTRSVERKNELERVQAHGREQHAQESRDRGQHRAFRQHLPDQAARIRAQRRAHADLALPHRRARQHQVGHVGARDQQHQSHRAREQQQARPDITHNRLQQRGYAHLRRPVIRHPPRKQRQHLAMQRPQLSLRPARCHAVAQPSDCLEPEDRPRIDDIARLERDGNPELRFGVGKMNLRRSHPDDFAIHPVQHHGAADNAWVGAELLLPEAIAENDDPVLPGCLLCGREEAPHRRAHRQGLKQVGADRAAEGPARRPAAGHVVLGVQRIARDAGEAMRTALVLPDPALGIIVVISPGRQLHQPVLVRKRQRLKQDGIDDAEDRRIGPDAQRQGQNRHHRKAAAPVQLAQRVTNILHEPMHLSSSDR